MSKYYLALGSAVLSFLGAVILAFSFQVTSTGLLQVQGADNSTSFCVGKTALFKLSEDGDGLAIGAKCPLAKDSRPTAVVNTDRPWLSWVGWIALIAGFLMRIFAIQQPKQEGKWKKKG